MSVTVVFGCDGCNAKADSTAPLRRKFESFSGRGYGFGVIRPVNTIDDVVPEGWVAFDPYTHATYCPTCWQAIITPKDAQS